MISEIFTTIGQSISGFLTNLGDASTGIASIFWDTTNNKLTFLGTMLLITAGVSLVVFLFKLVKSLVRRA